MAGLRRLIFWEFPRAGWQYDIAVAGILAFIFLTPRAWFKDQPRPVSIVELQPEHGARVMFLEADLLPDAEEQVRFQHASALLDARTGRKGALIRLEPIYSPEQEIRGFMAYLKP
jgi:hypothetical protein